jgi:hypothetical protein
MESKFRLVHYIEYQKTLYAAQQLWGSARAWWATYSKLKEFLDLKQGNYSVLNYTRQFNTLAQYGSYHVDADEKKANLYREGLTI